MIADSIVASVALFNYFGINPFLTIQYFSDRIYISTVRSPPALSLLLSGQFPGSLFPKGYWQDVGGIELD
ncbi:hypothetical protein [Leptolyngbya sp. FACHB-16]|uniref:hypothetical protein n=1 Tax=unclassified Leptolyngbya TaxID=2650499 RepID=UPI001684747D|nr:hypothetical protein [Leptolyngbya sp. FACHB-16]MBD2153094.1 hypothetical protein [Leptolyngbya sp. FACHB-16]